MKIEQIFLEIKILNQLTYWIINSQKIIYKQIQFQINQNNSIHKLINKIFQNKINNNNNKNNNNNNYY